MAPATRLTVIAETSPSHIAPSTPRTFRVLTPWKCISTHAVINARSLRCHLANMLGWYGSHPRTHPVRSRRGGTASSSSPTGVLTVRGLHPFRYPVRPARPARAAPRPPNRFDFIGRTPLHYAVAEGHMAIVERLPQAGADVNAHCEGWAGNTPLGDTIREMPFAMAKRLIDAGADPAVPGLMGQSALDRAANRTDADARKILRLLEQAASRR